VVSHSTHLVVFPFFTVQCSGLQPPLDLRHAPFLELSGKGENAHVMIVILDVTQNAQAHSVPHIMIIISTSPDRFLFISII